MAFGFELEGARAQHILAAIRTADLQFGVALDFIFTLVKVARRAEFNGRVAHFRRIQASFFFRHRRLFKPEDNLLQESSSNSRADFIKQSPRLRSVKQV